jgi:integrase
VQVYDRQARRARQVGTFNTISEARAAERDAQVARITRETVGSFAARWMRDYPRPAESTMLHYSTQVRAFVKQYESRYLDKIDRPTARAWAIEHPSHHASLRAMFSDAYRDDIVSSNPFQNLGLRRKTPKRDLAPEWLTEADVRHLADTARLVHDLITGELIADAIVFCAYSGIRPGEMYALEWNDIQNETIRIDRAARSSTRTIDLPKHHARRTIVLTDPAREALDRLPLLHDRLVFPTPTGKQCWSPRWHGLWNPVRNAAGRPGMAWHELRHFAATWLLELGLTPADVAVQLGHRDSGKLIMEVYGHTSDRLARGRILDATSVRDSRPYSRSIVNANATKGMRTP